MNAFRRRPALAASFVGLAIAGAWLVAAAPLARAQTTEAAEPRSDARLIEFDHPSAGDPIVQVALPPGMFADVRGLIDAALAGVLEALNADASAEDQSTKLAAQHLGAVREVTKMLEGAVEEVRVEVYGQTGTSINEIANYYSGKLADAGWDQVVRANDGGGSAHVFILRESGALRGVFVVAGEHNEIALVNAACDLSPERLHKLTRQLTSMWLEVGGREHLKHAAEHLPH